ncbi:eukaryotic translation elongation factor 1 epsilon-1-like [Anthonomus grandis grandis]|uniref:eukaryotic translation elongation factor 1 epsilon-1-like n=1 Tax=Anthonomus grandis grandis TaxID=2921223 RepID=UPI002165CE19|nr:eukaryotic translation elongation factor 1 epsilon-1-like [Anthonomus grandis grandis]
MTQISQCFNSLAQYLNTPVGKITKQEQLYVRTNRNHTVAGTINIIFTLLKESKSTLGGKDPIEEALIHQWLDYALVYGVNANNNQSIQSLLQQLDGILATKTYLVGNRLTIADAFLYYVLLNIMTNLTYLEKEKYINVSRWFDNIQQDAQLRQKNGMVNFSTIYLANLVPVRH